MIERLPAWIEATTGVSLAIQEKFLWSLITILLLVLLRAIVLRLVLRRTEDPKIRYWWRKTATYLAAFIGLLLVARIWFQGVRELATYLGLVSAGIAIALRDAFMSLAGWVFLLWRTPFRVGDRIRIGEHAGDVVDIRLFQFTLLEIGEWVAGDQSTGRVIHVPNALVFTEPVTNYTRDFDLLWDEASVLITFESDWRAAKEILEAIVAGATELTTEEARRRIREASRRFMIFYEVLTPKVYTSVADSGVLLTMRYLVDPRRRRGIGERIWEQVLEEFGARDDIDFAYPTRRLYYNPREGKPGARVDDLRGSPPDVTTEG